MKGFYSYLSGITGIDEVYIYIVLNTLLVVCVFLLIKRIAKGLVEKNVPLIKQYSVNNAVQIVISIFELIILFFVWDNYIKSVLTLVGILGASFIVALRECVLSFFGGIYIRVKRLFVVGDRIEVDGIKGDVVSISTFDFDVLEISQDNDNGQSTGVLITIPNSYIYTKNFKNYTKGFKYIWHEIVVNVTMNSNLVNNKKELYRIVNNVDCIKNIVNKMKEKKNVLGTDNNIYFSKYDPIIYTKIVEDHIELTIRYLVTPSKSRTVESVIWNKIYESYKDNKIKLYMKG